MDCDDNTARGNGDTYSCECVSASLLAESTSSPCSSVVLPSEAEFESSLRCRNVGHGGE